MKKITISTTIYNCKVILSIILILSLTGVHCQTPPTITAANITTTQSNNPAKNGDLITTTWNSTADGNVFSGASATFNGSSDYIIAFPTSEFSGANSVTFKATIKITSLPSSDRRDLFSGYDGVSDNRWSIGINPTGTIIFYNAKGSFTTSTTVLTAGTHELEFLADFANNIVNFKVNGVDETFTGWTATGLDTSASLYIGKFGVATSKFFEGEMWDVSVLVNGTTHARYPLSEGGGLVAHDVSGNSKHATIIGALPGFWANNQTNFTWNTTNGYSSYNNQLKYSEDFTNSSWINPTGANVTQNADGVAEEVSDATSNVARLEQIISSFDDVANKEFMFKLKVKAQNANDVIGIGIYKDNTDFDSATAMPGGTLFQTVSTNVNGVHYTLPDNTNYHDVWVRVKYGPTSSSVSLYFIVYINGFQLGINSGSLYIKEAQVFEWKGVDHTYAKTTGQTLNLETTIPGLENLGTVDAQGNNLTVSPTITDYSNVGGGNVIMTNNGSGVFSSSYTIQPGNPVGTKNISVSSSNGYGTTTTIDDDDIILTNSPFTAQGTDWDTPSHWNTNSVPLNSDDVIIPNGVSMTISSGSKEITDLSIETGATLSIASGTSIKTTGDIVVNNSGELIVNSDATKSGSLLVTGTVTGNITYNRHIDDTDWHLVAAPVTTQNIPTFVGNTNNAIATSGNKFAVSYYKNSNTAGSRWTYHSSSPSGENEEALTNFTSGLGYATNRTSAGDFSFIGQMATSDVILTLNTASGTHYWHSVGNPYPAFLPGNNNADATNVLGQNITALDPSFAALYIWNGSAYDPINHDSAALRLAPGQAFMVKAKDNSEPFTFSKASQFHYDAANTFYKGSNANRPQVDIELTSGNLNSKTRIKFASFATLGLDVGYDAGTYQDATPTFSIDTHLVDNSQGIDFTLQYLPDSDYESFRIPLSIRAQANQSIIFSANISNLPDGMDAYLEDTHKNTIHKINGTNHTLNLTTKSEGTGRFYVRFSPKTLSTEDLDPTGTSVAIFKTSKENLRIIGLQGQGKTNMDLYDVLGRKIITTSFEAKNMNDVSLPATLNSGIYIVKITTKEQSVSKKLIIQ